MGCNNSKSTKSIVVQSAGPKGRHKVAPSSETSLQRSRFASNPDIFQAGVRKNSRISNDNDSLFGNADSRHSSAGSKSSKHSTDSGFANNEENNMWDGVITEESDPALVEQIENEFCDQELDLCVTGTSVRQIKQDRDVEREEERNILLTLRQEGLLVRPESRAQGGLSFEITEDTGSSPRRPPPRLEKLELTRRKKKKREMTAVEIEAKLAKAEERRKRKEQERIDRINAKQRKEQDDVLTALESFQEHQKRTEEGVFRRQGSASENRQRHLQELREKQKAKREHEEMVRNRRKSVQEQGDSGNGFSEEDKENYSEFSQQRSLQFDPRYDDER